jgi:hypothetical protein
MPDWANFGQAPASGIVFMRNFKSLGPRH